MKNINGWNGARRDVNDERWLWLEGEAQGPYSVKRMMRMAASGEVGPKTLFWSNAKQQWLPFTGVMFDIEPSRLKEIDAAGIMSVMILGSGQDDCPACSTLINKVFPIVAVPDLPPPGCQCVPWCRLVAVASS